MLPSMDVLVKITTTKHLEATMSNNKQSIFFTLWSALPLKYIIYFFDQDIDRIYKGGNK